MKKKFLKNPILALLLSCTLTAGSFTFPVSADTTPHNTSGNNTEQGPANDIGDSAGKDTGTNTDNSTDKDTGKDADNGSGADTDKDISPDTGKDINSGTGADNTTGKDAGTDHDTDNDSGNNGESDTDSDSGSNKDADTDSDSDSNKDADTSSDSDSNKDADTGSDSGSDADAAADNKPDKDTDAAAEQTEEKQSAKVIIHSQNIAYGETFAPVFSSDPADAKVFGIISGFDRDGNAYLSIDVSNITLNDIAGTTLPENGEQSLQDYILEHAGNELTLRELSAILDSITQLPGNDSGEVISGIRQAIDTIGQLDEQLLDTPVIIGGLPSEPGVYTAIGVTASPKYTTAIGMGTLTITSRAANVTLIFNQEFDNTLNLLPYEQMNDFQFGGHVTEDDPEAESKIHTLYTGTSFDGEFHSQATPVFKPGIYTETVYIEDENYFAVPITRIYTIQRQAVEVRFDNPFVSVRYDGKTHGLTAGVYAGDTRIAEASVTYVYIGFQGGNPVSLDLQQPTDVGVYLATAVYLGDATHQPAINMEGILMILNSERVISIYPIQPITLNKADPLQYVSSIGSSADTGDSTSPEGNTAALILSGFAIIILLIKRKR